MLVLVALFSPLCELFRWRREPCRSALLGSSTKSTVYNGFCYALDIALTQVYVNNADGIVVTFGELSE